MRIYLDNAATSYPKAPGVGDAVKSFIDNMGENLNRSGYQSSLKTDEMVFETRERLASLFNFPHPENVVFTMNITQSLNFILKGLLQPSDHVIVSSLEHNAVMRPLRQLQHAGVELSCLPCDETGKLLDTCFDQFFKPNTKMVVLTHASNVSGTVLPVKEVGSICKEKGVWFVLDTAQTAGFFEIDLQELNVDALAFTGHKSLLGPQGIGGFLIYDQLAETMNSLISGGTGSMSEFEEVPPYLPDKFEAGTLNLPGLCGLNTSLQYLEQVGLESIREKELRLTELLMDGFANLDGVRLVGPRETKDRVAVVSVDFIGYDNAEVAYHLDRDYGIRTRCGLHCAPAAHMTLGTFPQGTVRFSPSHFNTEEEMKKTLSAVRQVLKEL